MQWPRTDADTLFEELLQDLPPTVSQMAREFKAFVRAKKVKTPEHLLSWLRVFRRAEASRISPGVGQQFHTSAVRSEKCVRLRGSAWASMRVIAVFFCPHAPDLLTWRMSVLSHDFKRLERFTKLATSSFPDREADDGVLAHEEVFTVRAGDETALLAVSPATAAILFKFGEFHFFEFSTK